MTKVRAYIRGNQFVRAHNRKSIHGNNKAIATSFALDAAVAADNSIFDRPAWVSIEMINEGIKNTLRECKCCNEQKPLRDFFYRGAQRTRKDGVEVDAYKWRRDHRCMVCRREAYRQHAQARKRNAVTVGRVNLTVVHQQNHIEGLCYLCDCPLSGALAVDHVVPLAVWKEGNRQSNLAVVHDKCNAKKAGKHWTTYPEHRELDDYHADLFTRMQAMQDYLADLYKGNKNGFH